MKTLKFFFASVLVTAALVSCQKDEIVPLQPVSDAGDLKTMPKKPDNGISGKSEAGLVVRYIVVVHLSLEKALCNRYRVELADASGRIVAVENYDPAKSAYSFMERVRTASGVRIARLSQVNWPSHFVCETELYTRADIQVLMFSEGGSYDFNLYPSVSRSKNKDTQ